MSAKTSPAVLPILVLLAACAIGAFTSVARAAEPKRGTALAPGRKATETFYAGDTAALWERMDDKMRSALGGEPALAAFHTQVAAQLGKELEVLSEDLDDAGGIRTYRRTARFEKAPVPVVIQFSFDGSGRIAGFYVRPEQQPAPSEFEGYTTKIDLRLPFAKAPEGDWTVFWGGRTLVQNYHVVNAAQRFAYDLLVMKDGSSRRGESDGPDDFYCWGLPIVAPAAGIVSEAVDGLPDQAPGTMDPANPAGNHVVIDHGEGEFSLLAHLQNGSVEVKTGAKVGRGQLLGLCGNSGNTTEPHLHYHLQTAPTFGEGVGLPAQFQGYAADGEPVERGEPTKGQVVAPGGEGSGD